MECGKLSSKTPTSTNFKKRVDKKRALIQARKYKEARNWPDGMFNWVGPDYDGPLEYGMTKFIEKTCEIIWWDGTGWRWVKSEYGNTSQWSKYWTPVSKDDAPAPGKETLSPSKPESVRRWWQFSKKSKHTNT